jgi:hypothetical protein
MESLTLVFLTALSMWAGIGLGQLLQSRLPEDHLQGESRDMIRTASGLLGTVVALTIGLLVGSAKSTFDQANEGVIAFSTRVIQLDQALRRFGPVAEPLRGELRESMQLGRELLWYSQEPVDRRLKEAQRMRRFNDVLKQIEALPVESPGQELTRKEAAVLGGEVGRRCGGGAAGRSVWQVLEKSEQQLPPPLIAMLIVWLGLLFFSFGLLAPANRTALGALVLSSLAMAGALFMLLEMNQPFDGFIEVSPGPLETMLDVLSD